MRYRKLLLGILLVFILLSTTGCVKGEILLELGRTGSASLNTKILVPAFVKENLKLLKDKFIQDNFKVMDIKENNLEGFQAVRNFDNVSQMRELKVFQKIELPQNKKIAKPGEVTPKENSVNSTATKENLENLVKKPQVVVEKGFLFDKYKIDLNVDLRTGEKLQPKEENWLIKNLLAQIDLKFILKLPTEIDVSNANKVSEDGRTLMWNLVLGEENQIVAEATILNLKNAGLLFIAVVSIGGVCFYNYQKRKS